MFLLGFARLYGSLVTALARGWMKRRQSEAKTRWYRAEFVLCDHRRVTITLQYCLARLFAIAILSAQTFWWRARHILKRRVRARCRRQPPEQLSFRTWAFSTVHARWLVDLIDTPLSPLARLGADVSKIDHPFRHTTLDDCVRVCVSSQPLF